jgi:hypothetical protein
MATDRRAYYPEHKTLTEAMRARSPASHPLASGSRRAFVGPSYIAPYRSSAVRLTTRSPYTATIASPSEAGHNDSAYSRARRRTRSRRQKPICVKDFLFVRFGARWSDPAGGG